GETTYTATFENPLFSTQTKVVVNVPATGHDWNEPTYVWADDNTKVTASRTCVNDETHVETETAAATYAVTTPATCEEAGVGTWMSAEFENEAFAVQTKTVEIPAIGHDWGDPVWSWAEDHSGATATFTCRNDAEHVETKTASVTEAEGTGEDEGYLIYTAAVTGPDGKAYTDVVKVEKPVAKEIVRVYGSTRYKTGLAIADEIKREAGIDKFDSIILATGQEFADALAGSYLSYKKNAPIVLTREKDVNLVNAYIQENLKEGGTVYVLGGEKAMPETWLTGLEDIDVRRLAGGTRYATNLEIIKEAGVAAGEEILICTGVNYADSLSAASTGKALFLVNETLTKKQKEMLQSLAEQGCTFTILGGENAITLETEGLIREVVGDALAQDRIAGSTRYRTSVLIAERYFPDAKNIVLAVGDNYPDGLCGGMLGVVRQAPIVLTLEGKAKAAKDYAAARGIHSGIVLGGPKLISDEMARSILDVDESVEVKEFYYK
ncbi:MAG: cell wall-binding repeat-containing protein, partial [Lachnospiraceae bacterium]|nr:cell wall-binding repeat-containing protein [Lachnospiraceae bacterium]